MKPFPTINKKLVWAIGAVALVGFVDALYLTIEHFMGKIPPCSVTGGCEAVLTSQYASVLGIPVSLAGAVFYIFVLASVLIYLEARQQFPLKLSVCMSALGFLASLWFVFLQVFIIKSFCAYCLVSAVTSTAIFILFVFLVKSSSSSDISSQ
jgi:uncharacterized membrane protein